MTTRIAAIIPARWASTRFPGKPLHILAGKPMIQHVWERCKRCKQIDEVYVATDDERIFQTSESFGAEVFLTSPFHQSGTDRAAEVAARLPHITHILNVQGDEPMMEIQLLNRLATALQESENIEMITAATPYPTSLDINNPNMVKVLINESGFAHSFSRSAFPYPRDVKIIRERYLHIGIYGYSKSFLLKFTNWEASPLEKREKLEQLRALEMGVKIRVLTTSLMSIGVDTLEDAKIAESILLPQNYLLGPVIK